MPSFVLDPLFAGRVVTTDVVKRASPLPKLVEDLSADFQTIAPLSALSADEVASLLDIIQKGGGSLEDSETPFVR